MPNVIPFKHNGTRTFVEFALAPDAPPWDPIAWRERNYTVGQPQGHGKPTDENLAILVQSLQNAHPEAAATPVSATLVRETKRAGKIDRIVLADHISPPKAQWAHEWMP